MTCSEESDFRISDPTREQLTCRPGILNDKQTKYLIRLVFVEGSRQTSSCRFVVCCSAIQKRQPSPARSLGRLGCRRHRYPVSGGSRRREGFESSDKPSRVETGPSTLTWRFSSGHGASEGTDRPQPRFPPPLVPGFSGVDTQCLPRPPLSTSFGYARA